MQAAIYLRISRDRTGEQAGVTRQQEDCQALADQLGWTVYDEYRDNDVSAVSGKPREHYKRMLADIRAGRVEAIIAWHPDRLYRRAVDLGELVEVCKEHNTSVATVQAGKVDLTTPTGRLVAGLLAQVATYEGEHKAERWRRSWRQAREAGRPIGQSPRLFGYTIDAQIIPEEAERVRWLAVEVIAGCPIRNLVRELNDAGIRTTRGNDWSPVALRQFLRNPRLAGHSTSHGEIVGRGQWEPILDNDTWETVRAMLAARSTPPPARVALLLHLIFCGREDCGAPLQTRRAKNGRRGYQCAACRGVTVVAEPVEEIVESYARERLSDPRVRRRIAQLRSGGASGLLKEIGALEERLAEIEETIAGGSRNVKMLDRAADRVRERIEELQSQLAQSSAVPIPADVAAWPTDLHRRAQLIGLVVACVWIDPTPALGRHFQPERVRIDPVGPG